MNMPTAKSIAYTPGPHGRPKYGTPERFRRIAAERGLVGLANDTKWNELLAAMRAIERGNWYPYTRVKLLDDVAAWGGWGGWDYDLPYPLVSVEWMDLTCRERRMIEALPMRSEEFDHTDWIVGLLEGIGFDIEPGRNMVRIFAYSPRDRTLLDEYKP